MRRDQGCLSGLLQLLLLDRLFNFLQRRLGFGRGCCGFGCGGVLLILFVAMACSILSGTDWTRFSF